MQKSEQRNKILADIDELIDRIALVRGSIAAYDKNLVTVAPEGIALAFLTNAQLNLNRVAETIRKSETTDA